MDENLKILIKDDKVDKLCGNNIVGIVKTVTSMKSNFEFLKIYVSQMERNSGKGNFGKILAIWWIIDDIIIEVVGYDVRNWNTYCFIRYNNWTQFELMTIFESEVKVFINCHEPIWTLLISILKFIFENLILLRDGCINTNKVMVIWGKCRYR